MLDGSARTTADDPQNHRRLDGSGQVKGSAAGLQSLPVAGFARGLAVGLAERTDRVGQLVELGAPLARHQQIALAELRIVDHVQRKVFAAHQIDELNVERIFQQMRDRRRCESHEIAGPTSYCSPSISAMPRPASTYIHSSSSRCAW